MKHSFTKKPGSLIELEVELKKEDFDPYLKMALDSAVANVELKGFRKGSAPQQLAEQAVNKEMVFETAVQSAVKDTLNEICQENNWTFIDQPKLEVVSVDKGIKYKGSLTIFPEIKLADYKKIASEAMSEVKKNIESISVSDEDIKKSIDWLRGSKAKTKAVDREAKEGDVVDIDFETFSNGKLIENASRRHDQFILDKGGFLPGFEEKIINRKSGEKLEFSLTAPADYWQKDLQGKKLDFKISVNNVLERELPEATDEFARGLGKFKDLNELRDQIKSGLQQERETKEKEKAQMKILEKMAEKSKIDFPQIMIDKTLDNLAKEAKEDKSKLEEAAKRRLSSQLIIYKIAEEENLKPTEEEVKDEVAKHQHEKSSLDKQKFYDYIYDVLQTRKVLEFLSKQ